jgi:hypothetical protein
MNKSKKQYAVISKQADLVQSLRNSDEYYIEQNNLNDEIRKFMKECNLSDLTAMQIIKLLSLANTHRPVEPWQFLLWCSMQYENMRKPITAQ